MTHPALLPPNKDSAAILLFPDRLLRGGFAGQATVECVLQSTLMYAPSHMIMLAGSLALLGYLA